MKVFETFMVLSGLTKNWIFSMQAVLNYVWSLWCIWLFLLSDSLFVLQAYAAAGTVRQNYANILLMLLRLRQACDHPLLVKGLNSESTSQVSTKMAKNLPREMQVNLLNILETLNICHLCSVSSLKV